MLVKDEPDPAEVARLAKAEALAEEERRAAEYFMPDEPAEIGGIPLDFSSPEAKARTVAAVKAQETRAQAEAIAWAEKHKQPVSGEIDGGSYQLMRMRDGWPEYQRTHNGRAAISIRVDFIRADDRYESVGGGLYNLSGEGWVVGVFDGGQPQTTHQEFDSRVVYRDTVTGTTIGRSHATHVTGTVAGNGTKGDARGMAPKADVQVYSFVNGEGSEMIDRGAKTVSEALSLGLEVNEQAFTVSNHSYGPEGGWEFFKDGADAPSGNAGWHFITKPLQPGADNSGVLEQDFGQYSQLARKADSICYAAPYYLPVFSAGNDRDDNPEGGEEFWYVDDSIPGYVWTKNPSYDPTVDPPGDGRQILDGFDTVNSQQCAKNVLTIGAVEDALTFNFGETFRFLRDTTRADTTDFSAYGPTDDGRIKPELMANGMDLFSADFGADNAYTKKAGTSMAAPCVSGAAILLQSFYNQRTSRVMRASTLKGLLIHTASPIPQSPLGPSYRAGYGLVDAWQAARHIADHSGHQELRRIYESALMDVNIDPSLTSEEFFIEPIPAQQVKATLCWTDPPGVVSGLLNERSPDLVHDLDLRISAPTKTHLPYRPNPMLPQTVGLVGDDTINPQEQISIHPSYDSRPYKIRVTTKGLSKATQGGLPIDGERIDLLRSELRFAANNNLPAPKSQVYSLLLSGIRSSGTLAQAVDNEIDEFVDVGSSGAGGVGWGYQVTTKRDGVDALRSPQIDSNETTGFKTTVQGPGELRFWAMLSAFVGDSFRFKLDGTVTGDEVFAESGWFERVVPIPAGVHELRWEFAKGSSGVRSGWDSAFVDMIRYTPTPVITSAQGVGLSTKVEWNYGRPCNGFTLYHNTSPTEVGATSRTVGTANCRIFEDLFNPLGGWYAVKVLDETGLWSPISEWVQSTVALSMPNFITASDGDFTDRVEVRWAPVTGADEYILTFEPVNGSAGGSITVTGTSYNNTFGAPGQVVTYSVVGRNIATGAVSTPTPSRPLPTDTGFKLDPASFIVRATDGSVPKSVTITWPVAEQNAYFRCLRTTTNVSPFNGGNAFVEVSHRDNYRINTAYDETAIPGVTYFYWVQIRPRFSDPEEESWSDVLGSDSGWAGAVPNYDYTVKTSDQPDGPIFHWIDISGTGTALAKPELITPISATLNASSQFYPVSRLADNSGLSGAANIGNFNTITHAAAADTVSWVTNAFAPDYFANGGNAPVITFMLPDLYYLTDMVSWGYHFGSPNSNEAKQFSLQMLGSGQLPISSAFGIASPALHGSSAQQLAFPGGRRVSHGVKMTIQDNWYSGGAGGDRVGLGEVKFIGFPLQNLGVFGLYGDPPLAGKLPSRHGYISLDDDDGTDSENASVLPAAPSNAGGSGVRIMPYHDALTGGEVYYQLLPNGHPHAPFGESTAVWQWEGVSLQSGGAPFSFQAIHFVDRGDWIFQYKNGNPGGGGATIGLQDLAKARAATYAANQEGAIPTDRNFAVLFGFDDPVLPPAPVTQLVTTGTDENDGALGQGTGNSLRELIAHGTPGADGILRIDFPESMAGQTVSLNSTIVIDNASGDRIEVVIDGSSAPGLVISGQNAHRIFDIAWTNFGGTGERTLTLKNLTLADGWAIGDGGAIRTPENWSLPLRKVTLENVTVTNCKAQGAGARGGAIAIRDRSQLVVINSTLSGNEAEVGGGAIWLGTSGKPQIASSTITANTVNSGTGGGIWNQSLDDASQGFIGSSIVAANTAGSGPDISGPSWSTGYNLLSSGSGATGLMATDLIAADPKLGPLADNGGNTKTHALLSDSVAVDAATGGYFLATDQRGVARGADGDLDLASGPGGPDIGAYELQADFVVTTGSDVVDANDGLVSLREMVQLADALGGGTILFDTAAMGTSTCSLSSQLDLDILGRLEIDGSGVGGGGRITITGGDAVRLLRITSGTVVLNDLDLIDGNTAGSPGDNGGALFISGGPTVVLQRCGLMDNTAVQNGGAIQCNGSDLTLVDCSVGRNTSGNVGGGIGNFGTLRLVGSTIGENVSGAAGGGIWSGTTLSVVNSTIAGNTSGYWGGGVRSTGTFALENSIVAGNTGVTYPDISGTVSQSGEASNLLSGDPLLTSLGLHGGPTETMVPMAGSPALDVAADNARSLISAGVPITTDAKSPASSGVAQAIDGDPDTVFEAFRGDLLAYWDFNGGTADVVGGRDGTLENGAVLAGDVGGSYVQDFDGFADGTTDLGDGTAMSGSIASVQGDALRLSDDAIGSTLTNFRIPALPGSSNGWTASFDFEISTTGTPADGFSFNWGSIPASGVIGSEYGLGESVNHVSFSFVTYTLGPQLSIRDTGPAQAFQNAELISAGGTVSGRAEITYDPVHGASFRTVGLNNNVDFVHIPLPTLNPDDMNSFIFVARTGGLAETVLIDNLRITAGNAGRTAAAGDQALQLDATSGQGLRIPNAGEIFNGPAATETLTVSWWQRQRQRSMSTSFWALSPSTNDSGRGIAPHLPWVDDNIYFDTAGCCASDTERISGPSPAWVQWNQWTHVALVRNGINKEVWIDGRLALGGSNTEPLPTDFTELLIGFSNRSDQTSIDGWIDDFAVFGSALNGAEISQLMNTGIPTSQASITASLPGGPDLATELRLTSGPDRPEADPSGFRLEGSNDGLNFDLVHEAVVPPFESRGETLAFEFTPTGVYKDYRVVFTGVADPSRARSLRVAEIELRFDPQSDQRGAPRSADGDGDSVAVSDLGAAESQGIAVNTALDENDGIATGDISLRDALNSTADIVFFDPLIFDGEAADTITLTHGELAVAARAVSVDAAGLAERVTVSGNDASRVFNVTSTGSLSLRDLVIRDGSAPAEDGGGIRNQGGFLRLDSCLITENSALKDGGGLRSSLATGVLVMQDTTVSNNEAEFAGAGISIADNGKGTLRRCTISGNVQTTAHLIGGGGIFVHGVTSEVALSNCTIEGNVATLNGGGIYVYNLGSVEVSNCTISGNTAPTGGGVFAATSTVTLENSIVAGNSADNLVAGSLVENGVNITTGDPRLAPLGDYGGLTETMALRHDSPALDAGDGTLAEIPLTDQRGLARFSGGGLDIGAFESAALSFISNVDLDGDGIADEWETFYGLNPGDPADAMLDLDGDGSANGSEFQARTNATSSNSFFRILSGQTDIAAGGVRETTLDWASEPGMTYSLWSSTDLSLWEPIPNTNIIAVEDSTRLTVASAPFLAEEFYRVGLGVGDDSEPFYAEFRNALRPVTEWTPAGIVSGGNGTLASDWLDGAGDDDLFAEGTPTHLVGFTPTGADAIQFEGGASDDVLTSTIANYALTGKTAFTVTIAFQPDGDSESDAGNAFNKSVLVSCNASGKASEWTLGYDGNAIYFGINDPVSPAATMTLAPGVDMVGDWWVVVASWTADDGSGNPSMRAWLHDRHGNLLAETIADPNSLSGSIGAFTTPLAATGVRLGGNRLSSSARNFDGQIAAVKLYDQAVNADAASSLAEEMANAFTSDQAAE